MTADLDELETLLHVALTVGNLEQAAEIGAEIDAFPAPAAASTLASALWYAEQGLHVFPLAPGSKVPHKGSQGCKDASTDEHTIRAWWDRWPDSNLGIATGYRVDVVDVDGPLGQASRAKHWELFTQLHQLGATLTPRPGGMHIYTPAHPDATNGANLLPGVDLRALGGYVVAPPSVTDVGTYRWLHPLNLAPPASDLFDGAE